MGNLENSINFNNVITPEEEKSPSTNKTPEQIEEQGFIEKVIKKVATKILKQFFKKKSPTDYIESTPEPTIEHLFRKYPGEQPTDITDYFLSTNDEANEIETIESFHDKRTAMDIHTHPSASTSKIPKESYEKLIGKKYNMKGTLEEVNNIINKRWDNISAIPSDQDIYVMLQDKKNKTSVIGVRSPKTGEVLGYSFVRKTKKTPKQVIFKLSEQKKLSKATCRAIGKGREEEVVKNFKKIVDKYYLQFRLVPNEGYKINKYGSSFEKKKN